MSTPAEWQQLIPGSVEGDPWAPSEADDAGLGRRRITPKETGPQERFSLSPLITRHRETTACLPAAAHSRPSTVVMQAEESCRWLTKTIPYACFFLSWSHWCDVQLPCTTPRDVTRSSQTKRSPRRQRNKELVGNDQRKMLSPLCLSAGRANTSINQYNSFALVNTAKIRCLGKQEKTMTAARRRNNHLPQQVTSAPSWAATAPAYRPTPPVFSTHNKGQPSPGWSRGCSGRPGCLAAGKALWQANAHWTDTGISGWARYDTLVPRVTDLHIPWQAAISQQRTRAWRPTLLFKPQKPHLNAQLWRFFIYSLPAAEMLSAAPATHLTERGVRESLCSRAMTGNSLNCYPKVKISTETISACSDNALFSHQTRRKLDLTGAAICTCWLRISPRQRHGNLH